MDDGQVRERNLAMMLRRMIWMAEKETGDTSMKVLAGKARELLRLYNLEGDFLRASVDCVLDTKFGG